MNDVTTQTAPAPLIASSWPTVHVVSSLGYRQPVAWRGDVPAVIGMHFRRADASYSPAQHLLAVPPRSRVSLTPADYGRGMVYEIEVST